MFEYFATYRDRVLYSFPADTLLQELLNLPNKDYHVIASNGENNYKVTGVLHGKPILREMASVDVGTCRVGLPQARYVGSAPTHCYR